MSPGPLAFSGGVLDHKLWLNVRPVLLGVLASGRPYLACVDEDSEIARITREFGCGLLSAPQDPEGLARNILSLFQQKHLRQTLGQNARKASAFFDRRLGAQQYRVLFERLLHDKKGT